MHDPNSIHPDTTDVIELVPLAHSMSEVLACTGARAKDARTLEALVVLGATNATQAAVLSKRLAVFTAEHWSGTHYTLALHGSELRVTAHAPRAQLAHLHRLFSCDLATL